MTTKRVQKYTVTIELGTEVQASCTYTFDTEAERSAFLFGVDEAIGYMEYRIPFAKPKLPSSLELDEVFEFGNVWQT
jgi:hypothetical protein